ncbi:MAG TPA: arginyltransferase, partial [Sedimenticola sp.]|nr:arginyltransferase [Sedimenticola sp.]
HSPGVLAILWQIQAARRLGLPWLYLGYWVPGCKKMSYKAQYRPLQLFSQGQWQEFTRADSIQVPGINY